MIHDQLNVHRKGNARTRNYRGYAETMRLPAIYGRLADFDLSKDAMVTQPLLRVPGCITSI